MSLFYRRQTALRRLYQTRMQTSFPAARKLGPTSPSHEVLDAHHLHVFTRAVSQVLSTEIAKFTLAQLIDGLPVKNVTEQSVRWLDRDHPIAAHETLCDKVFEKTEIWLSEFSPSDLRVESWVSAHSRSLRNLNFSY